LLSAVAKALARCKAAQTAYDAAEAAEDEAARERHGEAEMEIFDELAVTPCTSDIEFIEKLRFMLARETELWGSPFDSRAEFRHIAVAVATYLEAAGKLVGGRRGDVKISQSWY
jgi:hypothetical protein